MTCTAHLLHKYFHTLSDRIGKVVASHAAVACSVPALRLHWFILRTRRSGGTAHEGGGCDQSIGSTISDAIVRSWLWLTATRSSPLGCYSTLLKVVECETFCGSRFSTGRLLAIEDFTFMFYMIIFAWFVCSFWWPYPCYGLHYF